jgi:hypothetical protein
MQWRLLEQPPLKLQLVSKGTGLADPTFTQGVWAPGVDCMSRPCGFGIRQRLVLQGKNKLATKRIWNLHLASFQQAGVLGA